MLGRLEPGEALALERLVADRQDLVQAEYSGRENVFLNGSLLGLTRNDIQSRFDQIVDLAELSRC